MEKYNQRVLTIIIVATVLIVVIIFAGVTYAFFTANNPEGSTAQIISENGRMLINYNDGTDNIVPVTNIQPSNEILVNKTFTLTGINTTVGMGSSDGLTMPYKVGVQYTSTFSDGMMHYYIKEVNRPADSNVTTNYVIKPEEDKTEDDYINQTIPGNETYTGYTHGTFKNGKKYTEMVTGKFPASLNNQTITFNLIIQFPDNNENQDSEKGKTFNGKVVVNYEVEFIAQTIKKLYDKNDKDSNGITPDGLQKDGTGAYNIKNLSTSMEKYNVSLLGNTDNNIIADTETDAYDNLRYVGANPKNYLKFNNEIWRIIGVFNNITNIDEQGKEKNESLVKIIRNDSLGNYSWNTSDDLKYGDIESDWNNADIMTELNTDYLDITKTEGSTLWYYGYSSRDTRQTSQYDYSNNIKSDYYNQIAKVRWNLGGFQSYDYSVLTIYNAERGTKVYSGYSTIWDGKVALMYLSDYGYASTNENCRTNINSQTNNVYNCKNNNWLHNDITQWTLSNRAVQNIVYFINSSGSIGTDSAEYINSVRPTLFLKSDAIIAGGTGTESDPFILE